MSSPIEKTLNRIGNVVQDIFSGSKSESTSSTADSTKGQTCLEATGMRQRELHLIQNMWRKNDIEYSRPLVLAEYDIQTEFLVSSTDDLVEEKKAKAEKAQTEDTSKAKKVKVKKKKKDIEAEKPSPVPGVDKPNKPVETLDVNSNRYYEIQGNVDTSYEGRA